MKSLIIFLTLLMCSMAVSAESSTINFNNVDYIHRWSKASQFEFTPENQSDLRNWTDMLTINYYKGVNDGERLALVANNILASYQQFGAHIIRTDSIPRTKQKTAEHLIVAIFKQPQFLEFVQARIMINGGVGASIVYSHRVYGEHVSDEMLKWMELNGSKLENNLMSLQSIPLYLQLKKLAKN
ncbi:hypothetical protein A3K86_03575 [Photobacterium jeanii]|uniref:Uncharacterized protein n=1 Tax=Photobacterium jeanii TaxID=858640 RepID=A0A178KN77_9GAMM|nr:hypothetical protein [Photobacterium jeanii]OAN18012.1 hypothetical protein A3K86_03575 [Photobacterium jeanii]PST92319.1 hypothetical protein C9I91_03865 [Photobacterium jeanii]